MIQNPTVLRLQSGEGGATNMGTHAERLLNMYKLRKNYSLTVTMSRAVDDAKAPHYTQATVSAMTKLIIVQRY